MLEELRKFINNNQFNKIGITGGAGSGKSFLTECLMIPHISVDSSFIGDSHYRKELLENKSRKTIDSYIDACNQYNWWNWDEVETEYNELLDSHGGRGIIEGAILGPDSILSRLDIILFMNVPSELRFNRLRKREGNKRVFTESLERFLITEYSEGLYYIKLINDYEDRIYYIGENYGFVEPYKINHDQAIPLRIRITE